MGKEEKSIDANVKALVERDPRDAELLSAVLDRLPFKNDKGPKAALERLSKYWKDKDVSHQANSLVVLETLVARDPGPFKATLATSKWTKKLLKLHDWTKDDAVRFRVCQMYSNWRERYKLTAGMGEFGRACIALHKKSDRPLPPPEMTEAQATARPMRPAATSPAMVTAQRGQAAAAMGAQQPPRQPAPPQQQQQQQPPPPRGQPPPSPRHRAQPPLQHAQSMFVSPTRSTHAASVSGAARGGAAAGAVPVRTRAATTLAATPTAVPVQPKKVTVPTVQHLGAQPAPPPPSSSASASSSTSSPRSSVQSSPRGPAPTVAPRASGKKRAGAGAGAGTSYAATTGTMRGERGRIQLLRSLEELLPGIDELAGAMSILNAAMKSNNFDRNAFQAAKTCHEFLLRVCELLLEQEDSPGSRAMDLKRLQKELVRLIEVWNFLGEGEQLEIPSKRNRYKLRKTPAKAAASPAPTATATPATASPPPTAMTRSPMQRSMTYVGGAMSTAAGEATKRMSVSSGGKPPAWAVMEESLKKKLAAAEAEADKLRADKKAAEEDAAKAKKEAAEARQAGEAKTREVGALQERVDALAAEKEAAAAAGQSESEQTEAWKSKAAQLEEDVAAKRALVEEGLKRIGELEFAREEGTTREAQLASTVASLETKVASLTEDNKEFSAKMSEVEADQNILFDEITARDERIAALEAGLAEAEARADAAEEESGGGGGGVGGGGASDGELAAAAEEAQEQLNKFKGKYKDLMKENERLLNDFLELQANEDMREENDVTVEEVEELRQEMQEYKTKYMQTLSQVDQLKSSMGKSVDAAELEVLKKRNMQLEEELEAKKESEEKLLTEAEKARSISREATARYSRDVPELRERTEEAEQRAVDAETRVGELTAELETLRVAGGEQTDEVEALRTNEAKWRERAAQLEEDKRALEATAEGAHRERTDAQEKAAELQSSVNAAEEEAAAQRKAADEARARADALAAAKESKDREVDELRVEVGTLTHQAEEQRGKREMAEKMLEETRKRLEEASEQAGESEADSAALELVRAEKEELQRQLDEERRNNAEYASANAKMINNLERLDEQNEELATRAERLESDAAAAAAESEQRTAAALAAAKEARNELRGVSQHAAGERERVAKVQRDLSDKLNLLRLDATYATEAVELMLRKMAGDMAAVQAKLTEAATGGVEAQLRGEIKALTKRYKTEMLQRKKYFNAIQDLKGKIRVFCRVRPMLPPELQANENMCTLFPEDSEVIVDNPTTGRRSGFEFDHVFSPKSTQGDVYGKVESSVTSLLDGYNVCIFAYGQTGSGKTYTMEGTESEPGILSRTVHDMFRLAEERADSYSYRFEVTMMEIYNEELRDLLASDKEKQDKYQIKHGKTGVFVPGMKVQVVETMEECLEVMRRGTRKRATAATSMNDESSRSHSIVTITAVGANQIAKWKCRGKLNLIDLAGSERVGHTGAEGDRLKEAKYINASLQSLGNVISALSAKEGHVPYRNSKLTHYLQDSLAGNSKTMMFVNAGPAASNATETMSSLTFACQARTVELGKATRNIERSGKSKKKVISKR